MDELATTLQQCLRKNLGLLPEDEDVDMVAELRNLGLDSMNAISLLLDVERAFSVSFPTDMLSPATFRTGSSLLAAIRKLKESQAGGD